MFFFLFAQARYYLPEIGRFISEDSYKGTLSDTQSQHRYIYCTNNPLKYIDPSGHTGYKSGYVDPYNRFINEVDKNWESMVRTGLGKMKATAVEGLVNIPGVDTVNDATVLVTGYDIGLQKQSRLWAVAGILLPVSGQTLKKGAKLVDKIPAVSKVKNEIVTIVENKIGKKGSKLKDCELEVNKNKPKTKKTNGNANTVNKSIKGLKNTENFSNKGLDHIFKGEINKSGKAVGFHVEGVEGSVGKVTEITKKPNKFGVYEGKIEVNGITKQVPSTFFPKNMSSQEIVNSINEAYGKRKFINGNTFIGKTKSGMEIKMFIDQNGKIISAFPKY